MNLFWKHCLIAVVFFQYFISYSQTAADTLILAKECKEQGKLREASQLLKSWHRTHSPQSDVLWVYAQNEYWRKNFKRSRRLYQQALELDSSNLYLRLDYANSLLNMGRLAQADKVLNGLENEEQQDPYALYLRAQNCYWSGDLKAATRLAQTAAGLGSTNAPVLQREIEKTMEPWMRLALQYTEDSQPMESLMPVLEAGVFSSKWLDLRVAFLPQMFTIDGLPTNFFRTAISNRFRIPRTRTSLGVSAGVLQSDKDELFWTGGLEVNQQLPAGWQITAGWAVKPYLETRASVDAPLVFQQFKVESNWQEAHGFWANLFYQTDIFGDKNNINTIGGWLLSPPLNFWRMSLRVGYAYSHSNAFESRYTTDQSVEDILNAPETPIVGYYKPYFTPALMETHSALAVLEFRPTRYFSLGLSGKYGFEATADNPYLYLGFDVDSDLMVIRAFENTAFTPYEYGGKMAIHFTDHLVFETNYLFSRIFFYDVQTAGGSLKYNF